MPFRFRWPFRWPGRPRPSEAAPAAQPSLAATPPAGPEPVIESTPTPTVSGPVRDERAARPPAPGAPQSSASELPEGLDLGQDLLQRLHGFSTPPTLGVLGGLPAMAQALPTVDRFRQKLSATHVQPLLPGGLAGVEQFTAGLSALTGFSSTALAQIGPPAFPEELETSSEPTDVLPPLGSLPGQLSSMSGAAPVLAARGEAPLPTTIVRVMSAPTVAPEQPPTRPAALAAGPEGQVQRVVVPAAGTEAPLPFPTPEWAALGPAAIQPLATRLTVEPLEIETQRAGALTQVLPPELTLTGNVLASVEATPVQRDLGPGTEEWASPSELVQPPSQGGERVTSDQRQLIEDQRGQGRPLEPATRQQFEQAYGQPLGDVRVHTGASAHAVAQSLNAIAFATGNDLFFTQNTYTPNRAEGLALIGHELAHVIQQQYGVSGDPDTLRPPDDAYEQHADRLSARALETPMASGPAAATAERAPAPETVQRSTALESELPVSAPSLPNTTMVAPGDQLVAAARLDMPSQPLGGALPSPARLPDEEPVQRYSVSQLSGPMRQPPIQLQTVSIGIPARTSLTEPAAPLAYPRPLPTHMLTNFGGLGQSLPGLGEVADAGQYLPILRRIGPIQTGLGELSRLAPAVGQSPPGVPEIGQNSLPDLGPAPGESPEAGISPPSLPTFGSGMPDLAGAATGMGAALPSLPIGGGGLPSLAGVPTPDMPLAPALGEASQAAAGAPAAGQQAVASITGAEPSAAEDPAAPPLPSLDKLTEHIWKQIQQKLKVERERARGLA